MRSKVNYYKVLDVDTTTNPRGIRKAIRRLLFRFHPGKRCDPRALECLRSIHEAYNVMEDSNGHSRHDVYLNKGMEEPIACSQNPMCSCQNCTHFGSSGLSKQQQSLEKWMQENDSTANQKVGESMSKSSRQFVHSNQCGPSDISQQWSNDTLSTASLSISKREMDDLRCKLDRLEETNKMLQECLQHEREDSNKSIKALEERLKMLEGSSSSSRANHGKEKKRTIIGKSGVPLSVNCKRGRVPKIKLGKDVNFNHGKRPRGKIVLSPKLQVSPVVGLNNLERFVAKENETEIEELDSPSDKTKVSSPRKRRIDRQPFDNRESE